MRFLKFTILLTFVVSCDNYLPGFDFQNFEGTKASELARAVQNENTEKIEEILVLNRDLIDFTEPKFGYSLLMLSVANNLDKSVKKLLQLGADPNKKSEPNKNLETEVTTAVFISCNKVYRRSCSTNILELLIKHGGHINDKIQVQYYNSNYITEETPLMVATESNCIDLVKKIVDLGGDINAYDYSNGKGPITNSIIHDNLNILEYLIVEKKANIPNYIFVRPAHNNSKRQELTIIELLNEQEYDIKSSNYQYRKKIIEYIRKNSDT